MAKTPTPKPASAIDAPTPAAPPPAQPWAQPATETPVETPPVLAESPPVQAAVTPAPEPITPEPFEPPAGTPLTDAERETNGLPPVENAGGAADELVQPVELPADAAAEETPAVEPKAALNAPPPEEVPPVEDKLTLGNGDGDASPGEVPVPEDEPTGDDGRPDGFIPGDQTAAGALTPPGGQHPGAPKNLHPGQAINLQDPYNVNGTARNQELLAAGHGIRNPLLDEPDPNVEAAKSDAEDAGNDKQDD